MGAPATTTPIAVGAPGPYFEGLRGVDGEIYSADSFASAKLLAIIFVSNGCPTVREYRDRLTDLQRRCRPQGLQIILVNANDRHLSPRDSLTEMIYRAEEAQLHLPYLKDETGELARALGATTTPHAFLLDNDRRLRYRGRIDDARLEQNVTTHDLEAAIDAVLAGVDPVETETVPFGCAIVR